MKVLTKELVDRILQHMWDETDYREEDYDEPKKILKESLGKRLSEIDYNILNNVIDDSDLHKEIEELKEEKEEGNVFD